MSEINIKESLPNPSHNHSASCPDISGTRGHFPIGLSKSWPEWCTIGGKYSPLCNLKCTISWPELLSAENNIARSRAHKEFPPSVGGFSSGVSHFSSFPTLRLHWLGTLWNSHRFTGRHLIRSIAILHQVEFWGQFNLTQAMSEFLPINTSIFGNEPVIPEKWPSKAPSLI